MTNASHVVLYYLVFCTPYFLPLYLRHSMTNASHVCFCELIFQSTLGATSAKNLNTILPLCDLPPTASATSRNLRLQNPAISTANMLYAGLHAICDMQCAPCAHYASMICNGSTLWQLHLQILYAYVDAYPIFRWRICHRKSNPTSRTPFHQSVLPLASPNSPNSGRAWYYHHDVHDDNY